MAEHSDIDLWALTDLGTPWCIHTVVTLQIAELLATGNTAIADLAQAADCDASSLQLVLRHLITKGLFQELSPGHFTLNEAAQALLDPSVQLGLNLDRFGGRMAHAWGTLLTAVRTGAPAYHQVFGLPFWQDLDAHPEIAADFDALMGPAGHGTPDPNILLGGDWSAIHTVVDVGGGTGTLLAEVLRTHPHLRGTLVDLPRAVALSAETFANAGVTDRVTTIGQSFFDPLPPSADLYILKSIVNDWPDSEAIAILRRCAEAARPTGRVLILGGASADDHAPAGLTIEFVLLGGKQRTLPEFTPLARAAGLQVTATVRQPSGRSIVECRPI